jgi:transcriptional regulator with XRE-family HTH domain
MPENRVLGKRLNKRRSELGLSLRDLAEKTALTASFLSQVERDLTNPSLKTLERIADALDVPLLYFLAESPSRSPVVRANDRPKLDLDDERVSYEMLTPDLTGKLEVVCGRLTTGCENVVRRLSVETEEFIYVLEGALLVGLEEQEYTLYPGDAIYLNGRRLTRLTCAGEGDVRWISVITPPVF